MVALTFYVVDVFAIEKYTGNQLAVFLPTEPISADLMQKIAREINFSETTFITSSEDYKQGYDVRIFTPAQELPFAGHPTLGTAYVIQKALIKSPVEVVNLNLKVGQIPVTWDRTYEALWMRQNPPIFSQQFLAQDLATILNIAVEEIDLRFPIQEVSTGVPFILVPLKTHTTLRNCRVNREQYFQFVEKTQAKSICVFCPETYFSENQLSVRVFADYLGVPEDPATGSANGCLAAYLVEYRYFEEERVNVRVEQGYEMGRPSLLLLKSSKNQNMIEVNVGGKVVLVGKGEFV